MSIPPPPAASRGKVIAAFTAVYISWGSTYLAIRIGVGTIPPFLLSGIRFLIAGGLLYTFLRLWGTAPLTRTQWKNAAIVGTLLIFGGNALVCWGEQTVPSSLTALIVAAAPFWFAVFEALRPEGRRPTIRTVLGLVLGFSGVILLVFNNSGTSGNLFSTSPWGVLALSLACASWAGGSIYGKYHHQQASSVWMTVAAQMLCGGAVGFVVATLHGDLGTFRLEQVSHHSWLALVYLIVFGAWVGYGAYIWLLKHCVPAKVATYAYVNPVIATLLGWLVLGEPLTPLIGLAAAIILSGVLLVQWPQKSEAK
jgi:drug/metabolite transporter (DMT)-like permease